MKKTEAKKSRATVPLTEGWKPKLKSADIPDAEITYRMRLSLPKAYLHLILLEKVRTER